MQGFREAGKKVYCYMDYAGNGSYALACSADHITLAEYSVLGIVGLHAEASFYKGLLDKIGVYADLMHCGAYKSALEPFTRTEPSPEAAENINWLLDGIYGAGSKCWPRVAGYRPGRSRRWWTGLRWRPTSHWSTSWWTRSARSPTSRS